MHESEQELRPCPFCGSDIIRDHYVRDGRAINCAGCGAGMVAYNPDALAVATKRWNTRHAEAELVEALAECANDLEAEIADRYPQVLRSTPSGLRRYNNDMETVRRARAALSRARSKDEEAG